jgi:tetratricopeptide (TPR) repeat protein
MPTDQAMLDEAISAARGGEKVRARDLLTRLLRIDKDHPEHWLWMSAVVESRQEQIYCLQNLLRVDPDSVVARRGLIMMGALQADPKDIKPVPPHRRQAWTTAELELERPRGWKALMANPVTRITIYLTAGILALSLITLGAVGLGALPPTPTPNFSQTAAAVGAVVTLTPTRTPSATITPAFPTETPTPGAPTPLWFFLDATYTPTPLYVDTPHPETQAFRLGMNARTQEDWEAVIEYMGQALEIAVDAADPHYYLGDAYLQLGQFEQALEAFDQALLVDNRFGAAYLGRALATLALYPNADVIETFEDAVEFAPDFPLVYLERARYFIRLENYTAADSDLEEAARLAPESPLLPYLRAVMAHDQGDFETALELADRAHAADFTHLPTYLLLGEVHLALDDPLEAREWLITYLRYNMDDLRGLNLLALSYFGTGDFPEALDIFDRLIADGVANARTYYGRGISYLEVGDPAAALSDLNQATRLQRNDFEINIALGRALLDLGDPGDAYVQFDNTFALIQTDRQRAFAHFYRGLALKVIVENGDESSAPAAVRDLQAAIDLAELLPEELVEAAQEMLAELEPPGPPP